METRQTRKQKRRSRKSEDMDSEQEQPISLSQSKRASLQGDDADSLEGQASQTLNDGFISVEKDAAIAEESTTVQPDEHSEEKLPTTEKKPQKSIKKKNPGSKKKKRTSKFFEELKEQQDVWKEDEKKSIKKMEYADIIKEIERMGKKQSGHSSKNKKKPYDEIEMAEEYVIPPMVDSSKEDDSPCKKSTPDKTQNQEKGAKKRRKSSRLNREIANSPNTLNLTPTKSGEMAKKKRDKKLKKKQLKKLAEEEEQQTRDDEVEDRIEDAEEDEFNELEQETTEQEPTAPQVQPVIQENPLTRRLKDIQKEKYKKEHSQPAVDEEQRPSEQESKISSCTKESEIEQHNSFHTSGRQSCKHSLSKEQRKQFGQLKKELKKRKETQNESAEKKTMMENVTEEDQYYMNRCAICFDRIMESAKPESCKHTFCMDCILGWTKFHNICPLCKTEIHTLEKYDSLQPDKIVEKIQIQKPQNQDEVTDAIEFYNGPEFAEFCYICRKNDRDNDQLVCEHCDFEIAHYQCVGFSEIPDSEWYCPRCTREIEQRQREDDIRRDLFKSGKDPVLKRKKQQPSRLKRNSNEVCFEEYQDAADYETTEENRLATSPIRRSQRKQRSKFEVVKKRKQCHAESDESSNEEEDDKQQAVPQKKRQRVLDSQLDQPAQPPQKEKPKKSKKTENKDGDIIDEFDSDDLLPVARQNQDNKSLHFRAKNRKNTKKSNRPDSDKSDEQILKKYEQAQNTIGSIKSGTMLNTKLNLSVFNNRGPNNFGFASQNPHAPGGMLLNSDIFSSGVRKPSFSSSILGRGVGPINPYAVNPLALIGGSNKLPRMNPLEQDPQIFSNKFAGRIVREDSNLSSSISNNVQRNNLQQDISSSSHISQQFQDMPSKPTAKLPEEDIIPLSSQSVIDHSQSMVNNEPQPPHVPLPSVQPPPVAPQISLPIPKLTPALGQIDEKNQQCIVVNDLSQEASQRVTLNSSQYQLNIQNQVDSRGPSDAQNVMNSQKKKKTVHFCSQNESLGGDSTLTDDNTQTQPHTGPNSPEQKMSFSEYRQKFEAQQLQQYTQRQMGTQQPGTAVNVNNLTNSEGNSSGGGSGSFNLNVSNQYNSAEQIIQQQQPPIEQNPYMPSNPSEVFSGLNTSVNKENVQIAQDTSQNQFHQDQQMEFQQPQGPPVNPYNSYVNRQQASEVEQIGQSEARRTSRKSRDSTGYDSWGGSTMKTELKQSDAIMANESPSKNVGPEMKQQNKDKLNQFFEQCKFQNKPPIKTQQQLQFKKQSITQFLGGQRQSTETEKSSSSISGSQSPTKRTIITPEKQRDPNILRWFRAPNGKMYPVYKDGMKPSEQTLKQNQKLPMVKFK